MVAQVQQALEEKNMLNLVGLMEVMAEMVDQFYFEAERNLNTLIDYRYSQHFKAENGKPGSKKNKTGANGKDLVLKVPIGTQIYEEDNNTIIYDFQKNKEKYLVASGGKGGLGNVRFKSSTNRAPRKKLMEKMVKNFGFGFN